jgi:hypothetical protein
MLDVTNQLRNAQQLEAVVSGPGSANRLYICTGTCPGLQSYGGHHARETLVFTVGPTLTGTQVVQAIASAAPMAYTTQLGGAQSGARGVRVESVDADWDDEASAVRVRLEVEVFGAGGNESITDTYLSYQVMILAQL